MKNYPDWEKFEKSGKIGDYLQYIAQAQTTAAGQSTPQFSSVQNTQAVHEVPPVQDTPNGGVVGY